MVKGFAGAERTRAIEEQLWDMPIDTCALQGKGPNRYVKNKHGRHNNCMTDAAARAPSIAGKDHYADGQGSVVALEDYPLVAELRDLLTRWSGGRCRWWKTTFTTKSDRAAASRGTGTRSGASRSSTAWARRAG